MWVLSHNSVNVLRVSDGLHLMTPTIGGVHRAIAFDGVNMWVADYGAASGNTVSVLRASDGALVYTVTVGLGPQGIAFDGEHIWVTNSGSDTVTKIKAIYKTLLPILLK